MASKYTSSQVKKAWIKLLDKDLYKNEEEFAEVFSIMSYWRSSHEKPLSYVFNKLEKLVIEVDKNAIYAKRLKRYKSIVNKLFRFKQTKLNTIQDIWWCRVIVANLKKVDKVFRELKKWPEFVKKDGSLNINDYIKNQKDDWYRSVHLIWKFTDWIFDERKIEVQIRTKLQHDWATALEIVDLFTKQNLKSNQWKKDWADFFINISKQFTEMEKVDLFKYDDNSWIYTYYDSVENNPELYESHIRSKELIKILHIIETFNYFAESIDIVNKTINEKKINWYVLIEINSDEKKVTTSLFWEKENDKAEEKYAEKEKIIASNENCSNVIALVSTSDVSNIKEAYPNYFADSTEFLKYLYIISKSPF